jgi:hypothetical protein
VPTTTDPIITEPAIASPGSRTADGLPSMISYLTRVLKTPTISRCWEDLAAQARDENWSHEEYLAAVLQRQVAERESAGTTMRIRTAHFPQVKTLEEFNLDHLPSLRRDVLAHLATGTFIARAENVILLGPPGLGKTPPRDRTRGQGRPRRLLGAVRHRQQLDHPPGRRAPGRAARDRTEEDPPLQADRHRRGWLHPVRPGHREPVLPAHRLSLRASLGHGHLKPAFGRWGETFSDDIVAAAMIDRLVHHAEVLTLTGDSYRTRQRRELLAKQNRTQRD